MSSLGQRYDIPLENRLPEGAVVVASKYCELCGKLFFRPPAATEPYYVEEIELCRITNRQGEFVKIQHELRRERGKRFCNSCQARPITLEDRVKELCAEQDKHAAQLPDLDKLHRSTHPIRYGRPRRTNGHDISWRAVVVKAFQEKGTLTTEQLCDLIPGCYTPAQAYQMCKWALKIVRVGFGPRLVAKGVAPGLYALPGAARA